MPKISETGIYNEYPGMTIIAMASVQGYGFSTFPQLSDFFNKFTVILNSSWYREHYSILPENSLHLTAINLFTANSLKLSPQKWNSHVQEKSFKADMEKIIHLLEEASITPKVNFTGVACDERAISLIFEVDPHSKKKIKEISEKLGFPKIPKHFHITLAYGFKKLQTSQMLWLPKFYLDLHTLAWQHFYQGGFLLDKIQLYQFNRMGDYQSYTTSAVSDKPEQSKILGVLNPSAKHRITPSSETKSHKTDPKFKY